MTYYFWLGEDAEQWHEIERDFEGDWDAWRENEEMTRLGY